MLRLIISPWFSGTTGFFAAGWTEGTEWRTFLIPKHGGYGNLTVYQITEIIDDFTVRFCNQYVKNQGRIHDQMVQPARPGMQNIAEGSVDSGVSNASELKLGGIAKGSLQEWKEDYISYLRQHLQSGEGNATWRIN